MDISSNGQFCFPEVIYFNGKLAKVDDYISKGNMKIEEDATAFNFFFANIDKVLNLIYYFRTVITNKTV